MRIGVLGLPRAAEDPEFAARPLAFLGKSAADGNQVTSVYQEPSNACL